MSGKEDQDSDQDNTDDQDSGDDKGGKKPPEKKEDKPKDPPKDGDKGDDAGKGKGEDALKYELKAPKDSPLSADTVKQLEAFAKANNLSEEAAQAILKRESDLATSQEEATKQLLDDTAKKWEEEVKADKKLGGDNFKKTFEVSHRVLEKFAPKELVEELKSSPYRNNLGFIRFLSNVWEKTMKEDDLSNGQGAGGSGKKGPTKPTSEVFYGGSSK